MDKMIYTPEECAVIMKVPKMKVLELLSSGKLGGQQEGKEWRIHVADLEKYLDTKATKDIYEWMKVKELVKDEVSVRIADTAKEIARKRADKKGLMIIPDWMLHEAYGETQEECRADIKKLVSGELKKVSTDPARKLTEDELDEIIRTTYAK